MEKRLFLTTKTSISILNMNPFKHRDTEQECCVLLQYYHSINTCPEHFKLSSICIKLVVIFSNALFREHPSFIWEISQPNV